MDQGREGGDVSYIKNFNTIVELIIYSQQTVYFEQQTTFPCWSSLYVCKQASFSRTYCTGNADVMLLLQLLLLNVMIDIYSK